MPLLARPRIELTLVEEDEEAYQLTIRAQQPERKISTVSGLAFEVFTDPKRKFSVSAAPHDTSKVSLEDCEPHVSVYEFGKVTMHVHFVSLFFFHA